MSLNNYSEKSLTNFHYQNEKILSFYSYIKINNRNISLKKKKKKVTPFVTPYTNYIYSTIPITQTM